MNQRAFELFLLSLQQDPAGDSLRRLQQASAEDWRQIANLAQQFALAPLQYFRLKRAGYPLPEDVAGSLKNTYLRNTARNINLLNQLNEMLAKLQGEGIAAIVLKGGYLSEAVYEEIGLRVMADLDLLIPLDELERSIEVLEALGYKPIRPYFHEVDGTLHFHAPPLEKDGCVVELHWKLALDRNPAPVNIDEVWSRAQPFVLENLTTQALGLSDLILHLGVHTAYGHQFSSQLHAVVDLAVVLRKFREQVDWNEFIRICREWKTERGIYLMFRLAQDLMNAELPEAAMLALRPANWSEDALDWAKTILTRSTPSLSENFIQFMHGTSTGERIQALVKGLFPSRAGMAMIYGFPPDSPQILRLYPRHVLTRLSRYWGFALKSIRGDEQQVSESISSQRLREWLERD